ncbi:MAG: hypothetical protein HW387_1066 [Parachlamydiales bacterium]|nr:hypothetical protein [Parachlamydiales bacterium]
MSWIDLEKCFNRAIAYSFSKKKWLLAFMALVLCGILIVFCRAAAFGACDWVAMSLAFLPILLSSGILLSLGVMLVRIYSHETKNLTLPMRRLVAGSMDIVLGTLYLSLPPILIYLMLWIVLGFFYLLCTLPGIGDFFSIVLAFAPFLLILSSLFLCLFNLGLLFFVAPAVGLQSLKRLGAAQRVVILLKGQIFTGLALFFIALVPIALIVGLLSLAAILTNVSFLVAEHSLSVALEWFFIMIPFSAILAPVVVFFFNFAAECHWLLQRRSQTVVSH